MSVLLTVHPSVAARHRLEPGKAVCLKDFADYSWLVPGEETPCLEMIQRACGAAGLVPSIVARATDFSVLSELVAANAGVALIPRMALPDGLPEISLHPLTQPVTRTVFALTRAGTARRPDIRRVIDQLNKATV